MKTTTIARVFAVRTVDGARVVATRTAVAVFVVILGISSAVVAGPLPPGRTGHFYVSNFKGDHVIEYDGAGILLYEIPRVVVGENVNFKGPEQYLRDSGVDVAVANDPECIRIMKKFIDENPALWNEDIGELDIER